MIVKDTQEVARAAIVEEPFRPAAGAAPARSWRASTSARCRRCSGYVSTTPKPTSQVLLVSNQVDPVLSEWQYGLGHVVAWTSDAEESLGARTGSNWPEFSRFWAQVVKRTIPAPVDRNLQVQITPEGSMARVTVDSVADDKTYQNFLRTSATVVDPSNQQSQVNAAPDRPLAATRRASRSAAEGAYFLNIMQSDQAGSVVAGAPAGFVVPYSPEYRDLRANPDLLGQLAGLTDGQVVGDVEERLRPRAARGRAAARAVAVVDAAGGTAIHVRRRGAAAAPGLDGRRARLGLRAGQLARAGETRRRLRPPARLLAAKGRISIEGSALAAGRRAGPRLTAMARPAPRRQRRRSRTASSSALGARLLDASAGPARPRPATVDSAVRRSAQRAGLWPWHGHERRRPVQRRRRDPDRVVDRRLGPVRIRISTAKRVSAFASVTSVGTGIHGASPRRPAPQIVRVRDVDVPGEEDGLDCFLSRLLGVKPGLLREDVGVGTQ